MGRVNVDSYLDYKLDKDEDDILQERLFKWRTNRYAIDYIDKLTQKAGNGAHWDRKLIPEDRRLFFTEWAKRSLPGQNRSEYFKDDVFSGRIGLADQVFGLPLNKRTVLSVVTADVMHS